MTGRRDPDGITKLRPAAGRKDSTGIVSIPAYMMRVVPQGARFRAEWHEDGILFRFLGTDEVIEGVVPPPSWTGNGERG